MVPADDQAIVLPWASVIVIMVLLNDALTCATPDAMFLRSRRRTRVASLPILDPFAGRGSAEPGPNQLSDRGPRLRAMRRQPPKTYFFLPAIALAGPLRVRALVWVRWPRTGRPRRWRNPR